MAHEYQLGWQGEPDSFENARPVGLLRLHVQLWRVHRSQGGPYQLKERGGRDYGPERRWRLHWRRLRGALKRASVGDAYYSRGQKGRTAAIRVVRREAAGGQGVTPSTGTADVKRVYQEVTARFHVINLGIFNCRRIAGTSQWSEHAWAAAWDMGGSVSELDRVARYLADNRGRLNIENILWRGVANHYPSHIHVDFRPGHSGTPPCA